MKSIAYLNELDDQITSILDSEVHEKCLYSTYSALSDCVRELFIEIDELHKLIDDPTEKECDHCGGMVDITDQYCPECKTTIHWEELE